MRGFSIQNRGMDAMEIPSVVMEHAPWAPSKIDLLEDCLRAFDWQYRNRRDRGPQGPEALAGDRIHKILELLHQDVSLSFDAAWQRAVDGKAIPTEVQDIMRNWREHVLAFEERYTALWEGRVPVFDEAECRLGLTQDFSPCDFDAKAPPALLRGVLDRITIFEDGSALVLDHKSGQKRKATDYGRQLYSYLLLVVAAYPNIQTVKAGVHYVARGEFGWFPAPDGQERAWTREEIVSTTVPWLFQVLSANARRVRELPVWGQNELPPEQRTLARPTTSWKCRNCSFLSQCPEGQASLNPTATP